MAEGDDSWSVVYEAGCCMALVFTVRRLWFFVCLFVCFCPFLLIIFIHLVLINQTEWSTTPACSNHLCFLFNKVVLKGLRKKKFDVCIFCFIFVLGLI